MTSTVSPPTTRPTQPTVPSTDHRRPVDWRRLRGPVALACVLGAFVAAIGTSLGTVVAGRLAEDPSTAAEWQDWRPEIIDSSGQTVQIIPLDDPNWIFPSQH